MARDGSAGAGEEAAVDLWAMAAELEQHFAGYKRRLAERSAAPEPEPEPGDGADAAGGGGRQEEAEGEAGGGEGGGVRGRTYEAYLRRRDERRRDGWRARMEREEAEVKALWARLERGAGERAAAAGGDRPATTAADGGAARAAAAERKAERNGDDKRRSSDAALAPRRVSGKKHARTRSFSSSTTSRSRPDVGRRRALSQEPPPSQRHVAAVDARKDSRTRRDSGAASRTTSPTPRPKTSLPLRRKNSLKAHGLAKPAGTKPPRSGLLPRRASSGSLEYLRREATPTNAGAAAPLHSRSGEPAVRGETRNSPPTRPFVAAAGGDSTADARAGSPDSGCSAVVDNVADSEAEEKNLDLKTRGDEEIGASFDKPGNGEITGDTDTEPSYVYVSKDDAVGEQATSQSEPFVASDAGPELRVSADKDSADETTAPSDEIAGESAAAYAEEAPPRESSDESSFSGRSARSPPSTARPSCSSPCQPVERLLEADAAALQKKREERAAEKGAPKTPGSAGSGVSGTARSPREAAVRGLKKFLSFGRKNRGREVTVIDCTSPSVPSPADDDSASGGWQSAGSIKPRMGSSDGASDDTDNGYPVSPRGACSLQSLVAASPAKSELAEIVPQQKSPKVHRSFFSFRSLNCGRG
ncbi:hypothetical protein ACP4OV_000398 [Aristida adscensionis]